MNFWKHGITVYYMKLTFIFYQFNTKYLFIFSRVGYSYSSKLLTSYRAFSIYTTES